MFSYRGVKPNGEKTYAKEGNAIEKNNIPIDPI